MKFLPQRQPERDRVETKFGIAVTRVVVEPGLILMNDRSRDRHRRAATRADITMLVGKRLKLRWARVDGRSDRRNRDLNG